MKRVLAISLDGYERSVAEAMMAAGELPALARVRDQSARFLLDHGAAKRTGLGAEHVSTGLSPQAADRWSAVHFDPATYQVWQEGARFSPFPAEMAAKTIVFDLPYFDLSRATNVQGVSAWGAHDPGTELMFNPSGLGDEMRAKFGPYPAPNSIYAFAWPSAEKCRIVGEELVRGVELRADIALWLLTERFPDWDLGFIGVSESHSVLEPLWHGYDPQHPLHHHPSAAAARAGVEKVYRAIDKLIEKLVLAFPDATVVVFSMHGMGPNQSDVASMVLLPELLYRQTFGAPFLRQPDHWANATDGIPILEETERWRVKTPGTNMDAKTVRRAIAKRVPKSVKDNVKRVLRGFDGRAMANEQKSLQWMPAARYAPFWPNMRAFALPSFYDGRIRINLIGREHSGLVPFADYQACCQEIEDLLGECRDPVTGKGIVDHIEYDQGTDPLTFDPSAADMTVVWNGAALAFEHPRLGKIGPIPYRRTGGHTGPFGMAYIIAETVAPGDRGTRSSFDVVPTLFDLLGEQAAPNISGQSLLASET